MKSILIALALAIVLFTSLNSHLLTLWDRHQFITREQFAEIFLNAAKDDLHAWEFAKNLEHSALRKTLALSMLKKLLLAHIYAPRATMLGNDALETLCVFLNNPDILQAAEDNELYEIAERYLASIKQEFEDNILERQKNSGGTGCVIGIH